ncbi:MAG TPA: VOC family protein [Streptosporangiaceae bacterium]|nr:VOC family protein [Streptosporangiaceae bacterium]
MGLVAIVVSEYDAAIRFFVDGLGFELVEDSPALTNDGRLKRWVVVRPPGAATGVLLARADGDDQAVIVGKQAAGRVAFFLHVEDFDAAYARMAAAGVQFLTAPRTEPYGQVAVFADIAGNKWDLIGPLLRPPLAPALEIQSLVNAVRISGRAWGAAGLIRPRTAHCPAAMWAFPS